MGEPVEAAGPPCDGCGDELAAMSLLSFGDYSQVKVGVNCAPNFLRTIADSMDGRATAETPPEPGPAEPGQALPTAAEVADAAELAARVDTEPGSAKDHWASTTNVRRSTHGNRRPSSATGRTRKETDE